MNVFIVTAGSQGDVQPYVALGKGLKKAGHAVTVSTCSSLEPLIAAHGLSYGYMNNDFIRFVDSEAGWSTMEGGGNALYLIRSMIALMKDAKALLSEMMRDAWRAAREVKPDVVIFHPKALAGSHIAEKLGIPAVLAVPVPVIVPTEEFCAIGFPDLHIGGGFKKLTYKILHWLFPRVAAVVHHGGAGTTAAGLRAGKPSVICPFFIDQPLWGKRVHALGAGPKPIPQKKLIVDTLAEAMVEAVRSPVHRDAAAKIGGIIRKEDGIGNANALIADIAEKK